MAPKSSKKKKQSLALVVSTPEMAKAKRGRIRLKDNKWTPKPKTKKEEASSSKEKAPFGSGSAGKTSISEIEGFKMSMLGFMAQIQESMQKLHVKVDNVVVRLLLIEKKMQEIDRKMDLQRKGKEYWEEENDSEEEPKGERNDQDQGDEEDMSETESDASPLTHKSGHEYGLRRRGGLTKFSNTPETALKLTPSPALSPSTPIHVPQASPSHALPLHSPL
ncbi:hypothetical protein Acr_24g0006760 [Actinidia rufa]|uniref:Uncharacterized protein n=1 Tax=Actinidia rufa TaxID=165716 RepID=A0A7J0GUM2_9ERIC|nr:hypothetical protein Acr_24g0006760 [Actinidia rufa]